jgi:hypothetical protein
MKTGHLMTGLHKFPTNIRDISKKMGARTYRTQIKLNLHICQRLNLPHIQQNKTTCCEFDNVTQ